MLADLSTEMVDFDSAIPRFESWRPSQNRLLFLMILESTGSHSEIGQASHSEILFAPCPPVCSRAVFAAANARFWGRFA
jgi:hypothetical protein